jgi:molybdopterin-guanine dinucleotide biosynthesis protein A
MDLAAVVLAGGAARRMGGVNKAALRVGGVAMLSRVLESVRTADPIVVVGPASLASLLPTGVGLTHEEPPGGGPVAAAQAGFSVTATALHVALLAADLPFVTAGVVSTLHDRIHTSNVDGAVLVDDANRPQWLCGVWVRDRLAPRLAAATPGASVRDTVDGLNVELVAVDGRAWFDCDTEDDLRRAEEWAYADIG